ncbi:methyltransferase domain-containing protein [Dokdonella sp.]|uniref:class I SAM-dependent methyltransferase n=1 Tax=Dokdonella sp. TaxID=2291710 RepID=UPI0031C6B7BD|nr:class I SAM-dependent methyltransferase [Dokdonella sp.]
MRPGIIQRLLRLARRLADALKRRLRALGDALRRAHSAAPPGYAGRLAAERAIFAEQVEVHDLPAIFHYWSNTWLRPELEAFGFSNPDQFFVNYLAETAAEVGRPLRIASLGSGNCDTEIRVARGLLERNVVDFTIECIDINAAMLERGTRQAAEAGLAGHILPVRGDFNRWRPTHPYEAVLANQSLHHVVALEGLFAAVEGALVPQGRFIVSDMIGRNGHMRWPEAMAIIHEYWRELPQAYRWNVQLNRHEELLEDWDCSNEGFEGIRAQDILPLLIARFDFEFFFGFGNLIDPFIDRGFGPHFDAEATWDRDFIDRVHQRDEAEQHAGVITPTHMLAVLRRRPYHGVLRCRPGLEPARCVRRVPS